MVNSKTPAVVTHVITIATITKASASVPTISAEAAVVTTITQTSALFNICSDVKENIS